MKSWKSRCLGWKSIKFWSVDMKGREQYGVTYRNLLQGDMLPVRRPISLCNWTTQGPTSFLSLYVCLFCTAMPLGHVFPLARIGPIPGGTTVWFTIPLAPARPPPPNKQPTRVSLILCHITSEGRWGWKLETSRRFLHFSASHLWGTQLIAYWKLWSGR
jgi:hypothetical protein